MQEKNQDQAQAQAKTDSSETSINTYGVRSNSSLKKPAGLANWKLQAQLYRLSLGADRQKRRERQETLVVKKKKNDFLETEVEVEEGVDDFKKRSEQRRKMHQQQDQPQDKPSDQVTTSLSSPLKVWEQRLSHMSKEGRKKKRKSISFPQISAFSLEEEYLEETVPPSKLLVEEHMEVTLNIPLQQKITVKEEPTEVLKLIEEPTELIEEMIETIELIDEPLELLEKPLLEESQLIETPLKLVEEKQEVTKEPTSQPTEVKGENKTLQEEKPKPEVVKVAEPPKTKEQIQAEILQEEKMVKNVEKKTFTKTGWHEEYKAINKISALMKGTFTFEDLLDAGQDTVLVATSKTGRRSKGFLRSWKWSPLLLFLLLLSLKRRFRNFKNNW